ncbi:hypothetical protein IFM89_005099 [Coptis chinensis]|uniref:DNA-directed RNA polymerase subunit n=1 Tax=Coptis chinensis TaxID=261450 RepID=A0A835IHJ8_9MAGN|nr:hypothetical protein IFM89_005099 [Coptis chinensis]
MFFLSVIEHTLRLPPHLLNLPPDQVIKGELETLFLDKVITNLGLCVSVYDIRNIDGGFIFPGDGASTFTVCIYVYFSASLAYFCTCTLWQVNFRLIMFRPFVGEVLSGEVEKSDAKGLRLSLGFFKDITLPAHLLPNPSKFGEDGKWTWDFNGTELPIEKEDEIRFKVHNIRYPPIPVEQEKDAKPFAPMVITASIDFDGLGPISWWV